MKLIVACDPKGGIGYNNKLPWDKIQGDLPRFKKLTQGKVVVMGRNTWESLPIKPLPGRINFVVTTQSLDDLPAGTLSVSNLDHFNQLSDSWIIGGSQLINSSWDKIDEIHLTKTFESYQCDTFIDLNKIDTDFACRHQEMHSDHVYEIWVRKKAVIDSDIIPFEYFAYPAHESHWLPVILPCKTDECLYIPVWAPLKKHFGLDEGRYTVKLLGDSIAHYYRLAPYKKIVFLSHTEAFSVSYMKTMNKIINYIQKTHSDISVEDFLYVAGAHPVEDNLKHYKEICYNFNMQPIDTILVNAMEIYSNTNDTGVKFEDLSTIPRKKLKKFISLNGVPRLFRLVMIGQLFKHDLVNDSYLTLWLNQPDRLRVLSLDDMYVHTARIQFPNIAKESIEMLAKHGDKFPMMLHSTPNNNYDQRDVFIYDTSYFSLVTETVFAQNAGLHDDIFYECFDFSEKTFRPIKFKHPFVLLARPNSLKILREYGYKTFHPYINESYDTIENDEERLLAIIEEVKRLCSLSDSQWINLQRHLKDIVEFNHHVLTNIGIRTVRYTPSNLEEEE